MPENPYHDCKVSLRRPHGNGDLDIVGASYTHRKANVTEALGMIFHENRLLADDSHETSYLFFF